MTYSYINNVFILVSIYTGLMTLAGLGVYLMFYVMFKKLYGDKIKLSDPVKEDIVMCGEEPLSEDFVVPVSRVFVDIMSRSFRRAFKTLTSAMGTQLVRDWFFYMFIVLLLIIIVSVLAR